MLAESIQASLLFWGESPTVLELADGELAGNVKQRSPIGSTELNGSPLEKNFVIVRIPIDADDDTSSLAFVENWLKRNRNLLNNCVAQKTIEFCTFLEPNTGSRILSLPHSLVQLAAELGLSISSQAMRILTEDELRRRKPV
ncbi:MAG: hypothetical protein AAF394_13810 [Planctomycetota bacterium]